MPQIKVSNLVHQEYGETVGQGLDAFNAQSAPLDQVAPVSCIATNDLGSVIGGAIGRTWGDMAELQQLWVREDFRNQGIGRRLLEVFEKEVVTREGKLIYLETFSFQALDFYQKFGYQIDLERSGFPNQIKKYHLSKALG
jgi:ribosomal protein S18 acetylase RimI-like enzyme